MVSSLEVCLANARQLLIQVNKMPRNRQSDIQAKFWEEAGCKGYGHAIFTSRRVEQHVISKQWDMSLQLANFIGLKKNAKILELGCGDGSFANRVLAPNFSKVVAFDYSKEAIRRAKTGAVHKTVGFFTEDLTTFPLDKIGDFDCVFMNGFLHHVKKSAPQIISRVAKISPKVIIIEPNGNNFIRKILEILPSHRRQGEDSFRLKTMLDMFGESGYQPVGIRKINFFPQFAPEFLYRPLKRIEDFIESRPYLNRLCSSYVIGFRLCH